MKQLLTEEIIIDVFGWGDFEFSMGGSTGDIPTGEGILICPKGDCGGVINEENAKKLQLFLRRYLKQLKNYQKNNETL